jgi:hypothetical protein
VKKKNVPILEKGVIRDLILLVLSIGCIFLLANPRMDDYKWIAVVGIIGIVIYRMKKGEWSGWGGFDDLW